MARTIVFAFFAFFALLIAPAWAQPEAPAPTAAAPEAASAPAPVARWRAIPLAESRAVAAEPRRVASLDTLVEEVAKRAAQEAGDGRVAPEETWMTVIDCRDPHDPRIGSYQGEEPVYPASVIKLCYMLAAFDQMATGRLAHDADLQRDLELMIFESDNKATNRILHRLTNTGFGPSLEGDARESFEYKRRGVVRYLESVGLAGLFAANKTYAGGIPLYGRDVDFLGPREGDNYTHSNMMTTDATARLLYLVWRHAVVSPEACDAMMELMHRVPDKDQTFLCRAKPEGAEVYSKSGFTNLCRHDAAIFTLPDGGAIVVVVFTKERGGRTDLLQAPVVVRAGELVLEALLAQPGALDAPTQEEHD